MSEITITIDAYKNLKEAQLLVRRCKREMQKAGTWGSTPKSFTRTMLLHVNDVPVSVLCFYPIDATRALSKEDPVIRALAGTILIMGAYTAKGYRGKGAYKILWDHLIKTYKDDPDLWVIRSGAHKDNHASIAMQRKQGRDFFEQGKTHLRSRYWLRPTRKQNLIRKLNWLRYKTIGLPFREKSKYGDKK